MTDVWVSWVLRPANIFFSASFELFSRNCNINQLNNFISTCGDFASIGLWTFVITHLEECEWMMSYILYTKEGVILSYK